MAAHDPEGTTTTSAPAKARRARRATGRASSGCPELHAGCPQQVWPRGTRTTMPACSSTVRAARATEGATMSDRQVRMSMTRMAVAQSSSP